MTCPETGVITVCFLLGNEQPGCDLQDSPVQRGSYPSIVIPTDTKQRVQSPLERQLSMISTDRPEMESWPYEFLLHLQWASLVAQMIVSAYNVGGLDSIPGLGRCSGEGNGNPLQYSCLENLMD